MAKDTSTISALGLAAKVRDLPSEAKCAFLESLECNTD
jgi:hypothetical protein